MKLMTTTSYFDDTVEPLSKAPLRKGHGINGLSMKDKSGSLKASFSYWFSTINCRRRKFRNPRLSINKSRETNSCSFLELPFMCVCVCSLCAHVYGQAKQ